MGHFLFVFFFLSFFPFFLSFFLSFLPYSILYLFFLIQPIKKVIDCWQDDQNKKKMVKTEKKMMYTKQTDAKDREEHDKNKANRRYRQLSSSILKYQFQHTVGIWTMV